MSNVWFCSDLHFGHKNIGKFRESLGVIDEVGNRSKIKEDWKSVVEKKDIVYVLGDACFTMDTIDDFSTLPGLKNLVRGNHDSLDTQVYLKVFHNVYGLLKYKEFWLSHAPVHPDELRGKVNLHGHVHFNSIEKPFNPVYDVKRHLDTRYFNCCPENLWPMKKRSLISLDEIRTHLCELQQVT